MEESTECNCLLGEETRQGNGVYGLGQESHTIFLALMIPILLEERCIIFYGHKSHTFVGGLYRAGARSPDELQIRSTIKSSEIDQLNLLMFLPDMP